MLLHFGALAKKCQTHSCSQKAFVNAKSSFVKTSIFTNVNKKFAVAPKYLNIVQSVVPFQKRTFASFSGVPDEDLLPVPLLDPDSSTLASDFC